MSACKFRQVAIIFNQSKSKKKLDKYCDLLKKKFNCAVEVFATTDIDDITRKTQMALAVKPDIIVAAGGDGTLFYVINALKNHKHIPLSILPLGTGNDFSKMLGVRDVDDALRVLCEGKAQEVDLIEAGYCNLAQQQDSKYFCSTAGVGLFSHLFSLERFALVRGLRKIFGNIMNPTCTLWSIFTVNYNECRIAFDEKEYVITLKLLEISKIKECGGMMLTPLSDINNGDLNLWMIRDASILQLLRIFCKAFLGKHLQDSKVDYFTSDTKTTNRYGICGVKNMRLQFSQKLAFHFHGEFIGYTPEYFKVLPEKLIFLSNV